LNPIDPEPSLKLHGDPPDSTTPEKGILDRIRDKISTKFFGFGHNQLQIDAGQKKFGITECKDCGLNYNTNVPEDEKIHEKHHESLMKIPKFRGWANEEAYTITGCDLGEDARILYLEPGHKNISSNYVQDLLANMTSTLGVHLDSPEKYHFYIAVVGSKMVGLCAVEENVEAYLIDSPTKEKETVRLGVQRLFIRSEFRRKGIAKVLLKTITMKHFKGELLNLSNDFAFSSPTEDGRKFIQSVMWSDSFYVY
jgi:N-acetyltransferase